MRLHDLLAGLAGFDGGDRPEMRGEPGVEVGSITSSTSSVASLGTGASYCATGLA